jgi:hypothetical protein
MKNRECAAILLIHGLEAAYRRKTKIDLLLLGDELLDNLLEGCKWLTANQGSPIDHKARSALHTDLPGETGLLLDGLSILARVQTIVEGFRVQSQLLGKFLEIVFTESTLIFAMLAGEEEIMVFPKLILF